MSSPTARYSNHSHDAAGRLKKTGLLTALFVAFERPVHLRDTTCLTAPDKKPVSHRSFTDAGRKSRSSHTAVKGATEAELSHCDRPAFLATAATLRRTKTQYDKQTGLQPERTGTK